MAANATKLTMTDRPQQNSPLLRLPVELRTMIYDLALQDNLDDIARTRKDVRSTSEDKPRPPLPFLGALAILHTCRELRFEGIDAMRSLAEIKNEKLQEATSRSLAKVIDTFSCERTKQYIRENKECTDAYLDAQWLRDTLHKLAYDQLLFGLSQLPVRLPWTELGHDQKQWEIVEWYLTLTNGDKNSLARNSVDCENIWDELIEIVDSSVAQEERKQESSNGQLGSQHAN